MATLRGKILKTPDATPGLLFVDGQQKSFEINGVWRSPSIAPLSGQVVDVELDAYGNVLGVSPVTESELAKEQARQAVDAAGAKGRQVADTVLARVGKPALIALALLVIGWFFLDYYSVRVDLQLFEVKLHATFWRQLGFLHVISEDLDNLLQLVGDLNRYSGPHSDFPPTGLLGILGFVALLAPLLPAVWKDKRASLASLAPLVFTLLVLLQSLHVVHSVQTDIRNSVTQFTTGMNTLLGGNAESNARATDETQKLMDEQSKAFSKAVKWNLGAGFYLATLSTLFLAFDGSKKYLAAKGKEA